MSTDRSPGEWNLAVRQQAAVARLGQIGLQSSDLEELLREGMVAVAENLDLGEVALFELLPDGDALRIRAGMRHGRVLVRRSVAKVQIPSGERSFPGFAAREGVPVASFDLLRDPRFEARAPDFGVPVHAAIASPIRWEGRSFGVLCVYDLATREWTDDEIHFVQSIANTMGLAIQRAEIERDLRDTNVRLDLSLRAGGLGAWSWDLDRGAASLSERACELFGITVDEAASMGRDFMALVHPEDRELFRAEAAAAVAADSEHHHLYRIIRPDTGELRWIESWGRLLTSEGAPLQLVGVCLDVTERRRAEQLQQAILASEQAARIEAEAARERLAFLASASAVLTTSLDPEVTLTSLADLCVPDLADACFIDLVDDEGVLIEQAGRGIDETTLHNARALRKRRRELGPSAPTQTGRNSVLEGRGLIYQHITDEQLAAAAADPDHLTLMRRFDARSSVLAPLITRGRVIGVLTLVRTGESRPYDHEDLAFVEELAARAALGIDNGRLFHSRNRVARSLQAALLPPALPEIAGLAIATRYDVAEADVEIGGDFYDVIPAGDGAWGVVVGDVCGRGPDAAALTGLVRHTVRSAVVSEQAPSRVLAQTNEAVLQQIQDTEFCTAAYVRLTIDPAAGRVQVAASSAGHPRPVVVRTSGEAVAVDCAGTLLGVVSEPVLHDVAVTLEPGDALVLYTDGVTEARRGNDLFGEARLIETLAALAGGSAEEIAGGLDRAVAEFRRSARDDTAIVVVQAVPPA